MLFGCRDVCTREPEEQSGCVIDMIAFPGEWTGLTSFTECISCSVKNKIFSALRRVLRWAARK